MLNYCLTLLISLLFLAASAEIALGTPASISPSPPSPGMVLIQGGEFEMGTDDEESYAAERPAHRVKVDSFWIDSHEVTNEEFSKFVAATGYVTTAERKPDWEELKKQVPPGTPKPDDSLLVPGALVFSPPKEKVALNDIANWWSWVPGANWRHPEGPNSNLTGREQHPVVNVSWDDAAAYAKWAGKRLPTEAEWEYAARGGLTGKRYAWGNEKSPQGKWMANIWQGEFPAENTQLDGYLATAPVKQFPPNGYGLYDMIGNVWEWCNDWFDADYYRDIAANPLLVNPQGPTKSRDPNDNYSLKRVTRGGSFLCSDNYCINFRPSARRGTAYDSGASNIGFRCVISAEPKNQPKV